MTITLAPDARRSVGLFSTGLGIADHKPKIGFAKGTKSDKLVLTVTDMPIFRSGTFRDSMGYQHTWESIHIDQMVLHYDHLSASGIFTDVPVRKGHGSFLGDPMDSLIGWHTGLRSEKMTSTHDGNEYTYLLASYEIFDEEAASRIEGGHWRNRSSEVGFYLTNAEAEFWPVYQGFAYVDIPAVEGLNGFSRAVKSRSNFSMMIEQETGDMAETPEEKAAREAAEAEAANQSPAEPAEPAEPAADAVPAEPVQAAAAVPAVQPAEPAAPAAEHGAQTGAQMFTINGGQRVDFATAQAHIEQLESLNAEREAAVRGDFVSALAQSGKIAATQIDALTNHAQGLTPEQYASWAKSYDDVPASGLFGQYGLSGGDGNNPAAAAAPAAAQADEKAVLEGRISMLSKSMTQDQLEKTPSFKRLQELTALAGNK